MTLDDLRLGCSEMHPDQGHWPCAECVQAGLAALTLEIAGLQRELALLRKRTSPSQEECSCPEFCSWHARSNFEAQKAQIADMKPLVDAVARYHDIKRDGKEGDFWQAYAAAELEVIRYTKKPPCPSTYTHSVLGKLTCQKDAAHLHRVGDVEHRREATVWYSI